MQNLTIALIQTIQFWEDKAANYQHLESQHLNQIEPGAADLVLLPEMFNTGFTMNVKEMYEDMNGEAIEWLHSWAEKLDCQIGGSLIIKADNQYYNRFVIVSPEGILNYYDKRHLFRMAEENDYFTAGKRRVIHQIKGWKILLQVCYDLRFPVFSRNRTIEGQTEYDLVAYIANWPAKRSMVWKNLLQARAIENQAFCIGLNRVGEDGNGIAYSGDAMVIDPWGNVSKPIAENEEDMEIITLDYGVLKGIKSSFPAYLDAESNIQFGESIITTSE
jgi:predicted amidohydrolase